MLNALIEYWQRLWYTNRGCLFRQIWAIPRWDLHVFLFCDESLLFPDCFFETPLGTSYVLFNSTKVWWIKRGIPIQGYQVSKYDPDI